MEKKSAESSAGIEQVIAPKRETAAFLFSLRVKSYVVAGGFALGELRRSTASLSQNDAQKLTYLANAPKLKRRNYD